METHVPEAGHGAPDSWVGEMQIPPLRCGMTERKAVSVEGRRCGQRAGVEQMQQDAAQREFAAGGVVPLVQRVDAARGAARADGQCGDAERERQVGVGRAYAGLGRYS